MFAKHLNQSICAAGILSRGIGCLLIASLLGASQSVIGERSDEHEASSRETRNVFWVGADEDKCNFTSLKFAINQGLPVGTELRLASDMTYDDAPYVLENTYHLRGGYTECQGSYDETLQAQLSGAFSNQVLTVTNVSVSLENLAFSQGSAESGGGLIVNGQDQHTVTLRNTDFAFNSADQDGGAILVSEGSNLILEGANTIALNSAEGNGGGIACHEGSSVIVEHGSAIHDNSADLSGGGIHADDCSLEFYSGGSGVLGIRDNTAQENGGGLHALNNSNLFLDGSDPDRGDETLPIIIAGNEASSGGGIYIADDNQGDTPSSATLINTIIDSNKADNHAALFIGSNASFNMTSSSTAECRAVNSIKTRTLTCSKVINNERQTTNLQTPSIRFRPGSQAYIANTEITGNSHLGPAIVFRGTGMLENTLIADNVNQQSRILVRGDVSVRWSTLRGINLRATAGSESVASLEGLVLFDSQSDVILDFSDSEGNSYLETAACIIAPEIDSILEFADEDAFIDRLIEDDPLLVDPDNGNYRLSARSPAIDACAPLEAPPHELTPPEKDLDGFDRGIANSGTAGEAVYDLGAFEHLGGLLFRDRFEQD